MTSVQHSPATAGSTAINIAQDEVQGIGTYAASDNPAAEKKLTISELILLLHKQANDAAVEIGKLSTSVEVKSLEHMQSSISDMKKAAGVDHDGATTKSWLETAGAGAALFAGMLGVGGRLCHAKHTSNLSKALPTELPGAARTGMVAPMAALKPAAPSVPSAPMARPSMELTTVGNRDAVSPVRQNSVRNRVAAPLPPAVPAATAVPATPVDMAPAVPSAPVARLAPAPAAPSAPVAQRDTAEAGRHVNARNGQPPVARAAVPDTAIAAHAPAASSAPVMSQARAAVPDTAIAAHAPAASSVPLAPTAQAATPVAPAASVQPAAPGVPVATSEKMPKTSGFIVRNGAIFGEMSESLTAVGNGISALMAAQGAAEQSEATLESADLRGDADLKRAASDSLNRKAGKTDEQLQQLRTGLAQQVEKLAEFQSQSNMIAAS